MALVISINIDKKIKNLLDTLEVAIQKNVSIVCIQDMPSVDDEDLIEILKQGINTSVKIIHSSNLIRENPQNHYRCSTIILSDTIKTREILTSDSNEDTIFILSRLEEASRTYCIVNIYVRPKTSYVKQEESLNKIKSFIKEKHLQKTTIFVGDINATALDWAPASEVFKQHHDKGMYAYNNIKKNRGTRFKNYFEQLQLHNLTPKKTNPTYKDLSTGAHGYIDIAYGGNLIIKRLIDHTQVFKEENRNGHRGILITLRETDGRVKVKCIKKTIYKKISSNHFKNIIENIITNENLLYNWKRRSTGSIIKLMNDLCKTLYESLLAAQNSVTYQKRKPKNNMTFKFTYKTRTTARKIHRLRKQTYNRTNAPKGIRRLRLEDKIKSLKRMLGKDILNASRYDENIDLWQKTNELDRSYRLYQTVNRNNFNTKSPIMKQQHIEDIVQEKFPDVFRNIHEHMKTHKGIEISNEEVNIAMKNLNKKTHHGIDGVNIQTLKHAGKFIEPLIQELCKMSFYVSKVPEICQHTKGIIIPKKGTNKYRIVHVGSALMSIIEGIAINRLNHLLEKLNLLDDAQYGFTTDRSRHDLIARLVAGALSNRAGHPENSTTLISLDIKGAFDNVNQDILIDKIYHGLSNEDPKEDNFRFWLINYILDRQIKITYKNMESSTKKVCKGVPQGSALGPVLWNYYIFGIDNNLRKSHGNKFEVLKYADDILITYHGNSQEEAQRYLDAFINNLSEIDLEVEQSKCTSMTTKIFARSCKDIKQIRVTINNTYIENVNNMNHLGIRFNKQLRLVCDAENRNIDETNLKNNIVKLHRINQTGIIHKAQEWHILINSLITSILVMNNTTLLSIDERAQGIIDSRRAKVTKQIFGWPDNVSNKLVRIITNQQPSVVIAWKEIFMKTVGQHKKYYNIIKGMIRGGFDHCREEFQQEQEQLDYSIDNNNSKRFHFDPSKTITKRNIKEWQEIIHSSNDWILIIEETSRATQLIIGTLNIIRAHYSIKHTCGNNAYFHTLAALYNLSSLFNNICIIAPERGCACLEAIKNYKNSDHRIITLREKLADQKWTMKELDINQYRLFRTRIQKSNNPIIKTYTEIKQTAESWPDISDYGKRAKITKKCAEMLDMFESDSLTRTCRILCPFPQVWMRINPGNLKNSTMLMLTGLCNTCGDQLRRGDSIQCTSCLKVDEQDPLNQNIVLHRAFRCKEFLQDESIIKLKEAIIRAKGGKSNKNVDWIDKTDIENGIKHPLYHQAILRLLAKTAIR